MLAAHGAKVVVADLQAERGLIRIARNRSLLSTLFDCSRQWNWRQPVAPSDHTYRTPVAGKGAVHGQQRDALVHGLGNQQTVKRVAVDPGQRNHADQMPGQNLDLLKARSQQTVVQAARIDHEVGPTELGFDGNRPQRAQTECKRRLARLQKARGFCREPARSKRRPQDQVRVELQHRRLGHEAHSQVSANCRTWHRYPPRRLA